MPKFGQERDISRRFQLLARIKELDPAIFTKSGIMVGLGESREEVLQVMDDLRAADVDFPDDRQYLQPTRKHASVETVRHAGRIQCLCGGGAGREDF